MQRLAQMHWDGFAFIAYQESEGPKGKYDLELFVTEEQAIAYCSVEPGRQFSYTKSMCRAMSEGLKGTVPLVHRNGGIDVAAMVLLYHKRLNNEQIFNNKKQLVMNEKNYEYLKNQVLYSGFKDIPSDDLRAQLQLNTKEFELSMHTAYGTDKVKATLKFSKSDQSDLYFFNHYDVEVMKQGEKEPMKQRIFINNRGQSITLKEAYNLMEGRAVHKTLTSKDQQEYSTWLQMDFKNVNENGNYKINQYSEKYGFDLEKTLSQYPIKELENPQYRDALFDSLKKGNRQSVTFLKESGEVKRFVEATPQFKGVNFYDENNQQRVSETKVQMTQQQQDNNQGKQNSTSRSQQNKNSSSQTAKNSTEGEVGGKKKTTRRKISA